MLTLGRCSTPRRPYYIRAVPCWRRSLLEAATKLNRFPFLFLCALLVSTAMFAKTPVPQVNQPLVPASAKPGGSAFTLIVHGSGFNSGTVVNWNGSPRVTTFKSVLTVTAAILASDIASSGTAAITVTNAGVGTSNPAYFAVTQPTASPGWMAWSGASAP